LASRQRLAGRDYQAETSRQMRLPGRDYLPTIIIAESNPRKSLSDMEDFSEAYAAAAVVALFKNALPGKQLLRCQYLYFCTRKAKVK
jgi:hypothetical protein